MFEGTISHTHPANNSQYSISKSTWVVWFRRVRELEMCIWVIKSTRYSFRSDSDYHTSQLSGLKTCDQYRSLICATYTPKIWAFVNKFPAGKSHRHHHSAERVFNVVDDDEWTKELKIISVPRWPTRDTIRVNFSFTNALTSWYGGATGTSIEQSKVIRTCLWGGTNCDQKPPALINWVNKALAGGALSPVVLMWTNLLAEAINCEFPAHFRS